MSSQNSLVSRFPDAITEGALPLLAVYTVHQHLLKPHRRIIALWCPDDSGCEQAAVIDALIEDVECFIPAGAETRPVDSDFAIAAYVVR
jgi:hypothetical protein